VTELKKEYESALDLMSVNLESVSNEIDVAPNIFTQRQVTNREQKIHKHHNSC
jgi:hypothetical protein